MEKILVTFLIVISISFNTQADNLILGAGQDAEINIVLIPCTNNSDCDTLVGAECIQEFCECNGTKFCEENSAGSIVVTKIGQTCKIDADCNIKHSLCKEDLCSCQEGRVASSDERKCLQIAYGLGSTCEENIQCYKKVAHSSCQNEKCVCQQQMHDYNGACYRDVALGKQCSLQGECSGTNFAACLNKTCTCKEGYVQNLAANKCLDIATTIDRPCQEDIQCSTKLGKAYCNQWHCHCVDSYQFKHSKERCVGDMLLGEFCQNHTDCHGPEVDESRSECILGVCKCKSEFYEEDEFCASRGIPAVYVPSVLLLLAMLLSTYFNNTS